MTLLEHIQQLDKSGDTIYSDEYTKGFGLFIDINNLYYKTLEHNLFELLQDLLEVVEGLEVYHSSNTKDNIQYIDGPVFQFLKNTNLVIDWEVSGYVTKTRRPYFRLRGKRVTEDQAFEIIRRTDRFFEEEIKQIEALQILHFPNWWFNKDHFPTHYGWCHPNGVIGYNGITDKYPTLIELLCDIAELAFFFPYLDFVVAITGDDESYPQGYKWTESIEIGIWVHENTIEFMSPARTRKIYKQYEAKYEEPNSEIYEPKYYQDHRIFTADRAYLERCIQAYGLEPMKVLSGIRDYKWRGL